MFGSMADIQSEKRKKKPQLQNIMASGYNHQCSLKKARPRLKRWLKSRGDFVDCACDFVI